MAENQNQQSAETLGQAQPSTAAKPAAKAKKGAFSKIPTEVLLSPAGLVLAFLAIFIEVIQYLFPVPILDWLWMIPLQLLFATLLVILGGVSIKSLILPFVVNIIPVIGEILPTWIIWFFRMFF
jgi:hypothetical protein